jgi:cytochrome c oxidase assembly protein subunit 15
MRSAGKNGQGDCGSYTYGFVSQPMAPASSSIPSVAYKPGLAWFAALGSGWVFVLVTLGAFTTSIGAGMAFPDWPLSNGSLNPDGWLSDLAMFAEHSHRLSAGLMSAITIILAVWLWRVEERRWLRWLGLVAVALIFVQAFVGGLRVLLENHQVAMIGTSVGRLFAMLHACLAQVFVCTLAAIAAACSRSWLESNPPADSVAARKNRWLGRLCCTLLLTQLAIAAVMRHSFSGLAIPSFPRSTPQGDWLPQLWNFRVAIHFAHRVMALILSIAVVSFAVTLLRERGLSSALKTAAVSLIGLLAVQIYLGASVVWSGRNPELTTAHVIVGATTLALTFLLTWVLHRDVIEVRSSSISTAPSPQSVPRTPAFSRT